MRLVLPVLILASLLFAEGCITKGTSNSSLACPFAMNSSGTRGNVFPLVSWAHERGDRAFTLFPIYSYSWTPGNMRLWGACGILGRQYADTGEYAHWVLPFYLANRGGVFTVPWSRVERFDGSAVEAYLCGMGGRTTTSGEYGSSWAFPFYYHDRERLITPLWGKMVDGHWLVPFYYRDSKSSFTLPYAEWVDPNTDTQGWLSIPLLTWVTWSANSCRRSWGTLGGLVGAKSNAVASRWWAFPFYGIKKDGNARLDVFPCFTYDARYDGYVEASLFWRLFRYERNPVGGVAADLLFIPVWR